LQDISLIEQEGHKGALEEVLARKLITVPNDISNEESEVELEEETIEALEENP
jgi:hypothetical protein